MRPTQVRFFGLLTLAVLLSAGCGETRAPSTSPQHAASPCVGYWESATVTKGGIGSAIYVMPDGKVLSWSQVQVRGTYALDGDRLTMGGPLGGEKPHTLQITIDGDRMVQTADGGHRQVMTRSGAGSGLHGSWSFRHYAGKTAFQRFLPDGTTGFRLILSTIVVRTYDVLEDGAIALRPGKKLEAATLRLRDGALIEDGGSSRHVRAGDKPWFPLP